MAQFETHGGRSRTRTLRYRNGSQDGRISWQREDAMKYRKPITVRTQPKPAWGQTTTVATSELDGDEQEHDWRFRPTADDKHAHRRYRCQCINLGRVGFETDR